VAKLLKQADVNGDKLRQLRQSRGLDWSQIARLSSLSVSQVRALETGGIDCFYSLQIRNNAARKVAQILGVPDAEVLIAQKPLVAQVPSIEAVPTTPIQVRFHPRTFFLALNSAPWVGYATMSAVLLAGLVWLGLHHSNTPPFAVGGRAVTPASLTESAVPPQAPMVAQNPASVVNPLPVELAQPQTSAPPLSAQADPATGRAELTPASLNPVADQSCPFDTETWVLKAENPLKSSEKLSLMLYKAGVLCVQDGTGKVWREDLKPWLGRSYMGQAPWKLYSPVLPHAVVYFQGEKIKLTGANSNTIALIGQELDRR